MVVGEVEARHLMTLSNGSLVHDAINGLRLDKIGFGSEWYNTLSTSRTWGTPNDGILEALEALRTVVYSVRALGRSS
jgi:hypothetical protein